MKINEELVRAATFNPTKKTIQMTVVEFCKKIETREVTLPLYQRDMSWTIYKHIDLLNYQLLGKAPVAPISINEIKDVNDDVVPQITFVDRQLVQPIRNNQYSVTDGQQRLTTNYKAYINDKSFEHIYLDLSRGRFLYSENETTTAQIPVGILMNKDDGVLFDYIKSKKALSKPEVMTVILQIRSKLREYNYTVNLAENLTEEEQINWFEVLNNAGSRVTRIQMRFSKLKLNDIDIYTQYITPFKQKIEEEGYKLFEQKNSEVSIPISTLNCAYEIIIGKKHSLNYTPIPSDTRENQICALDSKDIERAFSITLTALEKALNFIKDNQLRKPTRIDYVTYLTGFFVFNEQELNEEEKHKLIDWYRNVNFINKSNSARRELFSNLLNLI